MKKIILAGAFDCITLKEVNLIKEGLKLAIGGELWVILYDGFQHFNEFGFFPKQSITLRHENLLNFVPHRRIVGRKDFLKDLPSTFITGNDDLIIFVHYGDDKNFPGRKDLKKDNIRIKFIKPYGKA